MSIKCPCGSTTDYEHCCGQYIDGHSIPQTPESLMRSRYTAYSIGAIDYIEKTMTGEALQNFDKQSALTWAKSVYWLGLNVLDSHYADEQGFVLFVARFVSQSKIHFIKEKSSFERHNGQWFYTKGVLYNEPSKAIPLNSPCYCSSGKKYKNCHGVKH